MKEHGSIYILTLAAAIILVGLALGMSSQMLQFRRTSHGQTGADQANVYAELGIRHALHFTQAAPNWRTLLPNGTWLTQVTNGQGSYTVAGIDPADGVLGNDDGTAVLTCTAVAAGITRQVQVEAEQPPLELLNYAVAAADKLKISNNVRITGNIVSNNEIDKSGSDTWVFGDAEAVVKVQETTNITGTIRTGITPKTFPDTTTIVDYYSALATPIPFQPLIQRVLLSPTNNPFGPTNAQGIYRINCGDQKLVIKDCRIVGTVILINPKSDSRVEISLNWQPASPDLPALILQGSMEMLMERSVEELRIGVDLSLPGEIGHGTILGVYPSLISGLIYVNGDLTLDKITKVEGAIIATGKVEFKDWASCQYQPTLATDPPAHFREAYLSCVPGAWREILP